MPTMQAGRLAFREEGEYWNAYFADKDHMEGAILLGSIRMTMVQRFPSVKELFMALMKATFEEVCREAVGITPEWQEPYAAPEHERTRS